MNICIFDTETTSLNKPFTYNIGYVIVDLETYEIKVKRDFVVEQIWHNLPLFNSAYYADKRPLYVSAMRAKKTTMRKFGHITQTMIYDFKRFKVENAYAYNSDFDERVFNFNCDWFKVVNPFDNVKIFDIRGYVHQFIANRQDYLDFCEEHELFTESGNYSTTAESVQKFVINDCMFVEEHTALSDSLIELNILVTCLGLGAKINTEYKTKMSIKREVLTPFEIIVDTEVIFQGNYRKKYIRQGKYKFTL